jgi:2-polyprenyl-3-methyl-5-hydroxy-6-metoxy-1,4-benzoquinol methylase
MNRRLRRAGQRGGEQPNTAKLATKPDPKFIEAFLETGWRLLRERREEEATELAVRVVRLQEAPETRAFFIECVKRWKAFPGVDAIRDLIARSWREAWAKPPELLGITMGILEADSTVGPAIKKAMAAWPHRLALLELLGATGLARISIDPLLPALLESGSIFGLQLERFLTSLRAGLLEFTTRDPSGSWSESALQFCCALAKQCYINEYVFDVTPEENDQTHILQDRIEHALNRNFPVPPIQIALFAAYRQLDCLPRPALLKRSWPKCIAGLLTDQIEQPDAERKLRNSIPQITPIADVTSVAVRSQYEKNPFPRWVNVPFNRPKPIIDEWMPKYFPFSRFRKVGKGANLDVLIAGCGTGYHSIMFAQVFPGARILAIDLSMASLCYAKRKTREMGINNVEYAQADILELGSLKQRFDVIASSGVLHHLAEPETGWRTLVQLLQPDGCMQIALYSQYAHRNLIHAQRFLVERGFTPSVESIRRARQALITESVTDPSLASTLTFTDFYCTSEFRDLYLPTQMHRFTIPKIQRFLDENRLEFIGLSVKDEIREQFLMRFPAEAEGDLSLWDKFEAEHLDSFMTMYEFWIQKKPINVPYS